MSQTEDLTCAVAISLARYTQAIDFCNGPIVANRQVKVSAAKLLCELFTKWLEHANKLLAEVDASEATEFPIDNSDRFRETCQACQALMPGLTQLYDSIKAHENGESKSLTTVLDEIRTARSSNG